jgi:hypothetical protein
MIIDIWNEVMIGNKPYDIHHYSEDGETMEVTIYPVKILPNGRRETITDYWVKIVSYYLIKISGTLTNNHINTLLSI